MNNDRLLSYVDRAGQFYSHYSSISPVAGRLLGYLTICEPEQQSINQLTVALKTSRSAIVGAVQVLENRHIVKRMRFAGSRNDLISFYAAAFENRGFDGTAYVELANLFKEGINLLNTKSPERHTQLEELVQFSKFLAKRMPLLQKEWYTQRDAKPKKK